MWKKKQDEKRGKKEGGGKDRGVEREEKNSKMKIRGREKKVRMWKG